MTSPIINSISTIDLENIKFNKLELSKIDNRLRESIIEYDGRDVYIKGPKMILGSDIVVSNNNCYIDLVFDNKSQNSMNFMKFVTDIDYLIIAQIHENSRLWYSRKTTDQISLIQIEQEYIPTIKSSTIFNDRYSLKLKTEIDKIEFYDQDDNVVPYQLIKENYQVIPLLHLSSICKNNTHIWTEWKLPQLKIKMPLNVINGCQLNDIEDSDSDALSEIIDEK